MITNLELGHAYDSAGSLAAHVYANGAPTVAFGVLVAAGIAQRRAAARHKRFMLLAAITLLPPGTGRLFGYLGLSSLNVPVYLCVLFFSSLYDAICLPPRAPGVVGRRPRAGGDRDRHGRVARRDRVVSSGQSAAGSQRQLAEPSRSRCCASQASATPSSSSRRHGAFTTNMPLPNRPRSRPAAATQSS